MFAKFTFLVFGLIAGLVLIQSVHSDLQEVVLDVLEDQLNIRHKREISPEFKQKHVFKQFKVEERFLEQHDRYPTADELKDALNRQVKKILPVYGARTPDRLSVLIIKDRDEYRRLRHDRGVKKRTVQRNFHQGPVDVTLFETKDRYQVAHFQNFPHGRNANGPRPILEKLEEGSLKVGYKLDGSGKVVGEGRIGHFQGMRNPFNLGTRRLEPRMDPRTSSSRKADERRGQQTGVKSSGPSSSSSDFPSQPSRPSIPLTRPSRPLTGGHRTSSSTSSLRRPQSSGRQNRDRSRSPVRPSISRGSATSDGISRSSGLQHPERQNRERSRSRDRSHSPNRAGKNSRPAGRRSG